MPECPRCNSQNAAGMMNCTVCGSELPLTNPAPVMAKPKAAVLIVEQAVLDESAAMRVAKRKGLKGKRLAPRSRAQHREDQGREGRP